MVLFMAQFQGPQRQDSRKVSNDSWSGHNGLLTASVYTVYRVTAVLPEAKLPQLNEICHVISGERGAPHLTESPNVCALAI
jgi:hypothetical protein